MALKIMIADPNEGWLKSAEQFFIDNQYEVKIAFNGKEAQLALYNDKYFCAIISQELTNHSSIQVLKFIQSNCTGVKVVWVMPEGIAAEDELDEVKLKKMGVTETIRRPFEFSQLKAALEGHQSIDEMMGKLPKKNGVSKEEEVDLADGDFCEIKINEFFSSKAVLFDIFIKLRSNRYVKILHAGDAFTKERIDKYKNEKKIAFLYFHKKDRQKFIKLNNHFTAKVIANKNTNVQVKMTLLKNVSKKYVEEAFSEGLKPQVIEQGKEVCENVFNMIQGEEGLFKLLKEYQDFDASAFDHAFLTTLFSTSIIKQFEWQSKVTIETAAMACMFHDIGKMKMPKELFDIRPKDMSEAQLVDYQLHPEHGAAMVEGNRLINSLVKQIIIQHHEHFDGSGFPYGKKKNKISTLANIVALASDFTHIIIDNALTPVEGLKALLKDREQVKKYNSIVIESFIKVFVDPKKIMKDNNSNLVGAHVISNKKAS